MSARSETYELMHRLHNAGIDADFDQANTLRRAAKTLHRWDEAECGNSDDYKSLAIERDEETGKPFMCIYPHSGNNIRYRIADREAGAIRRIEAVCKNLGLYYYHQSDCRGAALYVSKEALNGSQYTRGVCCAV